MGAPPIGAQVLPRQSAHPWKDDEFGTAQPPVADPYFAGGAPGYAAPGYAEPPPMYAQPPQGFAPAAEQTEGALEAKNWFALGAGLRVTEWALLAASISIGLIALQIIGIQLSGGDIQVIKLAMILSIWGTAGLIMAWGVLIGGWTFCWLVWPLVDRKWLLYALGAAGVAVLAVLLITSLALFGIGGRNAAMAGPGSGAAMIIVCSLSITAASILFNFFLNSVNKCMGHVNIERQPIVFAAVVGGLTLWSLIASLVLSSGPGFKAWLLMVSTMAPFATAFIWLWISNRQTSRDLRVSHAYQRI
jgi:hypothetical protein